MRKNFWRQSAAAILAAGLLALAAVAQEGATGEVKIEGEKPAATSASGSTKPAAKPVKPAIHDRDPFVNQVSAGVVNAGAIGRVRQVERASGASVKPSSVAASTTAKAGTAAKGKGAPAAEEEEVEEIIIPEPEVTITGIVKSGGGHIAIVNSGTQSYMVTKGQKLGDYKVSAITDTAVTFTHTGKHFKVPIDSFAATSAKKK
jgi:hypothetical protein